MIDSNGHINTQLSLEIINRLQNENNFFEMLIFTWGLIETCLDIAVLEEYELSLSDDPRIRPILDLNFSRKLDLQRKLNFLSNDNAKLIQSLQDWRNRFFHTGGFFFHGLVEKQKQEIIDTAKKAVLVILDVYNKALAQKVNKIRQTKDVP